MTGEQGRGGKEGVMGRGRGEIEGRLGGREQREGEDVRREGKGREGKE